MWPSAIDFCFCRGATVLRGGRARPAHLLANQKRAGDRRPWGLPDWSWIPFFSQPFQHFVNHASTTRWHLRRNIYPLRHARQSGGQRSARSSTPAWSTVAFDVVRNARDRFRARKEFRGLFHFRGVRPITRSPRPRMLRCRGQAPGKLQLDDCWIASMTELGNFFRVFTSFGSQAHTVDGEI